MGSSAGRVELVGRELRYVLTVHLLELGTRLLAELVQMLEANEFDVRGRPSKAVSDALRWEVRRGRVVRFERGRYGPGCMPASTRSRLRSRVRSIGQRRDSVSLGDPLDGWQ